MSNFFSLTINNIFAFVIIKLFTHLITTTSNLLQYLYLFVGYLCLLISHFLHANHPFHLKSFLSWELLPFLFSSYFVSLTNVNSVHYLSLHYWTVFVERSALYNVRVKKLLSLLNWCSFSFNCPESFPFHFFSLWVLANSRILWFYFFPCYAHLVELVLIHSESIVKKWVLAKSLVFWLLVPYSFAQIYI